MCRTQRSETRTLYRCVSVQGTLVEGRDAGLIAGRTGVRMCDDTTETPTLSLMEEFLNESFRYRGIRSSAWLARMQPKQCLLLSARRGIEGRSMILTACAAEQPHRTA